MTDLISRAKDKFERSSLLLTKRAVQSFQRLGAGGQGKHVVFVAGVQRSGTNMMMDVLERSLATEVFHESDPRAFDHYQMRAPDVIHKLVEGSPARYVVIKSLCELQDLRALLDRFAPANAVWMVRNYGDMVNSHLRKWSGCPATVGRIIQDRNSAEWRGRGMSEATLAVVAEHYHPGIDDASAVALFWWFRNKLFFEQGFEGDERVLPVRYESLVGDPQRQFRRVMAFLGIDYSERSTSSVFASSVGKSHQPVIETAVRALCDSMLDQFDALIANER